MTEKQTLHYIASNGIALEADLYISQENRRDITIVYLHGGGLLYGVRDDLPQLYIDMFLAAGYDLLALDYPLAPESSMEEIINTALEHLLVYINDNEKLGLGRRDYILFGRSAGAYLCFMLTSKLLTLGWRMPRALISLYGYTGFEDQSFTIPSKHYSQMSKVSKAQADKIITDHKVVYGPLSERFALYIKARQDASWLDYLGINDQVPEYSVQPEQLQQLPPLVMAAATLDPDVPYKLSKNLRRSIAGTKLITVYKEEHDFDRDTMDAEGKRVYEEIIEWLATAEKD